MSMRQVSIITDAAGNFSTTIDPNDEGEILGVGVSIGTLGDLALTLTDTASGLDLLDVASIVADAAFEPDLPAHDSSGAALAAGAGVDKVNLAPICYGSLTVTAVADPHSRGNLFIRTH